MHGRLGRAFEQQVERAGLGQIVGTAHVAVDEADAGVPQPGQRQLAAAAAEIVERA